jgi:hypothetical protein
MRRSRFMRLTASLVGMGTLLIASGAATTGMAQAAPVAVSPVGHYSSIIVSGPNFFRAPLVIDKGGVFSFPDGGPQGTWTESRQVLTMQGSLSTDSYVFYIGRSGLNLGGPKNEGTVILNGKLWGKWYAVRT